MKLLPCLLGWCIYLRYYTKRLITFVKNNDLVKIKAVKVKCKKKEKEQASSSLIIIMEKRDSIVK